MIPTPPLPHAPVLTTDRLTVVFGPVDLPTVLAAGHAPAEPEPADLPWRDLWPLNTAAPVVEGL